jgi:hypothetical protein
VTSFASSYRYLEPSFSPPLFHKRFDAVPKCVLHKNGPLSQSLEYKPRSDCTKMNNLSIVNNRGCCSVACSLHAISPRQRCPMHRLPVCNSIFQTCLPTKEIFSRAPASWTPPRALLPETSSGPKRGDGSLRCRSYLGPIKVVILFSVANFGSLCVGLAPVLRKGSTVPAPSAPWCWWCKMINASLEDADETFAVMCFSNTNS